MGVVYRARDPLLNREVAVKLVPSADLTPELEERFQREAQLVAQMDHPSIVPIHDLGRDQGSLFFVMPPRGRDHAASPDPRSVAAPRRGRRHRYPDRRGSRLQTTRACRFGA